MSKSKKANNPEASKKRGKHFATRPSGAHGVGKPNQPKEGSGFHSGRLLPKPVKVEEVDRNKNTGKAIAQIALQNQSDGKGPAGQNVVPAGRKHPTRVGRK